MSLDIRSHLPVAVDLSVDEAVAEQRMQRIETALLIAATAIAVVLCSVVSVLVHLA